LLLTSRDTSDTASLFLASMMSGWAKGVSEEELEPASVFRVLTTQRIELTHHKREPSCDDRDFRNRRSGLLHRAVCGREVYGRVEREAIETALRMAEKKKKKFSFFNLKRGSSQEKDLTPESLSPKGM
jgi:hypothetical protein